ncbi:hypothetical protein JRQ81_000417 [Phrynocephalus forsythii]|uniref:Uncharacterized protein n=1 Tax=Phrynocephalus forsythii TaxID=171643 RepID=A0A9Q0Y5Z1_9SAUR|nr:hypothetical protein JRQ81_000417 [Phrynocephalus forsythii]
MPQKTLSQRDPQRICLSTKPSQLENAAGGKGISTVKSSSAGGPSAFLNGKSGPNGLTGKSLISTISLGDHANLYCRGRPVCRIRPTSAVIQGGSVAHINHLHGELVRKRKLKQKLSASQQAAAKYTRLAEEASLAQAEAEKGRAEAEAQEKLGREQHEVVQLENLSLKEETQQLKRKLTELQLLLTQVEKSHFESQLKLERITMEKEVISEEKRYLEHEKNELKQKLKGTIEENFKFKEKCRTEAAEDALEKATRLHYEAEREKRLLELDKEEKEKQCDIWMKKYNALADLLHSQEEEKSKRQNKACQVQLKSYFLCIIENNDHITALRNEDGTLQRFAEGEQACFSIPSVETEDKAKSTDRILYKVTAPSSKPEHTQICRLCPVELQEKLPARRGKKIIEYFWFPVEDNNEE